MILWFMKTPGPRTSDCPHVIWYTDTVEKVLLILLSLTSLIWMCVGQLVYMKMDTRKWLALM